MDLILRKDKVILIAPMGAIANNIGGNTYYITLGISLAKTQKLSVSPYITKLQAKKTIIIINKISITDLSILSKINR